LQAKKLFLNVRPGYNQSLQRYDQLAVLCSKSKQKKENMVE